MKQIGPGDGPGFFFVTRRFLLVGWILYCGIQNPNVHNRDCWDIGMPTVRRNDKRRLATKSVCAAQMMLQVLAGSCEQHVYVDITPNSIMKHGIQTCSPFGQIHSYSSNDIAMNRNDIVMSWYIFNRCSHFNFIMELIQKKGEAENPL